MATSNKDQTSVIEGKTTFSPSAQSAPIKFDWGKLQPLVRPAEIGLISALLLIVVVTGYSWGLIVSANSGNTSNVASAWSVLLIALAILFGLLVSIGLPIWWAKSKGLHKALIVIAFEVTFLTLSLLISGFILFNGNNSNSTGNNQVIPSEPSCAESAFGC